MGLGLETVIIGTVVAGASAWAVRSAWRAVRKTGTCSSCASSGDCPLSKDPAALERLARGATLPPSVTCTVTPPVRPEAAADEVLEKPLKTP